MPKDSRRFLFATITPKPQYRDDVLRALQGLIPPTLSEPGCQVFAVLEGRGGGMPLYLFEVFADAAALEAHYREPYTRRVMQHYETWLAQPVSIVRMRSGLEASSMQFGPPDATQPPIECGRRA